MPAPCENPAITPHAAQYPGTPSTGPTSGLPSGVNVNAPFTHRLIPVSCSTGNRRNPIVSSGMIRSSSSGNNVRPKSHGAPSISQWRGFCS